MGHSVRQRAGRWLGAAALAAVAAIWAGGFPVANAAADVAVVAADDAKTPATRPDANEAARPGRSGNGRVEGRGEAGRGEGERRRGGVFGGGGLGPRNFVMGGGYGMGGGPGGAAAAVPSPEDRAAAMAFLGEHAPLYAKWITALGPPDNEFRLNIETTITRAYASYEALKPTDPQLYDVILKRIASEDRIFGFRSQLQSVGDDARAKLIADLRVEVTEWCDLSSKERHLRLARLERTVQQEKDKLAAEDAARDQAIENRVSWIVNGRRGSMPGGFVDGGGRRRAPDPADPTSDPQQGPR